MTQAQVIKALQNGPLTSHQVANLTGMPQATVLSTAKKLRYQGKISTEIVKEGRYWVAKYTLADHIPKEKDNTIICGIQTYGIFTPAEYRAMQAQANRLFRKKPDFSKDITNHQSI